MKISTIVVCKNEKETISKTLESIFSQSYKDFEIIVLDGNSTDGTLEYLEQIEDITLIKGEDSGIYSAMNKGIETSKGDILYFLNANDSLYSDNIFEKIIQTFWSADCDLVYGDTNFQSKDSNGELKNTVVSHKDFYSKFVWAYRNINHQSTFYKKNLFEKFGKEGKYDEKFKFLADVDFATKVVTKKEVKHIYVPIVIANYNAEGVSSYNRPENAKIIREEKEFITKTYLPFEYKLFRLYNKIFMPPFVRKFNDFLKEKFGLGIIFKIRDAKRVLARLFIWWTRKI